MNPWWRDARIEQAENDTHEAESLLRRATRLFSQASESYTEVGRTVPATHPNTRRDMASAASSLAARAAHLRRRASRGVELRAGVRMGFDLRKHEEASAAPAEGLFSALGNGVVPQCAAMVGQFVASLLTENVAP